MKVTKDIFLDGPIWDNVIEKFSKYNIFKEQLHFQCFSLAMALGIFYDKSIVIKKDDEYRKSVPRSVLLNNIQLLNDMFSTAILSTKDNLPSCIDDSKRINMAFDDEMLPEFDRWDYLLGFANYGATLLNTNVVKDTDLDTIYELNNYLTNIYNKELFVQIDKIRSLDNI